MNNLQVAKTIFSQLGGNRFAAMTGAKLFAGSENSLQFKIPKTPSGINSVRITLTPLDEYDMEFFAIRGTDFKVAKKYEGIYADQLTELFEDATGLRTSL